MGTILVEGIRLYAYHGCLEEEARIGGNYIVDVRLETDFERASTTDELDQTIDYVDIYTIVKEQMAIRSKLIEHVGKRILDQITTKFKSLKYAEVKVIKLSPPMNGNVDRVSVILKYGTNGSN